MLRTDKSPPDKGGFFIGTPHSPSALALRSRPPHSPLIIHPPTPFACASALALRPCPPPSPSALAHQTARYARGLAALIKTTLHRCRLAPASMFVSAGAPPPLQPRALRVPLRGAVSVLGVTACGMIAAPLSREVTLLQIAPSPVGLRGLWACGACSNARSVFARLPPWPLFATKGAAPLPPHPLAGYSFAKLILPPAQGCGRMALRAATTGRRSSPSVARR